MAKDICGEKILQFQGDHRERMYKFLVNEKIVDSESIKVHGF
jgi:hypothetical protein